MMTMRTGKTSLALLALLAATASGLSAAPGAGWGGTRPLAIRRPPMRAVVAMQHVSQEQKALVGRGGLVLPHIHAASLLISAWVDWSMRLGRTPPAQRLSSDAARRDAPAPPARATPLPQAVRGEPVFMQGNICTHVVDAETGAEHWECLGKVEGEEYDCRCAYKNGNWVYYCTKQWW